MLAINKNKISKELTLQQIIQKSTLRKNIDSISINDPPNNLSEAQFLFTNIKSSTSVKKNLKINNLLHTQNFISNHQPSDEQKIQRILSKNSTARTINSLKQTYIYNLQTLPDHSKKQFKDSQKSNQIKSLNQLPASLQKIKDSSKRNINKNSDFLCVKGSSSNPLNLRHQSKAIQRQNPLLDGMQNYKTLFQFSSQVKLNEKSKKLSTLNAQNEEKMNHHSFILTKCTTSNNFRQKSSKSIENKKNVDKKLINNLLLPQQFINKKIVYRGVKMQEKKRVKMMPPDSKEGDQIKRKVKNIEILEGINNKGSPIKQSFIVNNTVLRSQQFLKDLNQQNQYNRKDQKASPLQQANSTKGFRGAKMKSMSLGQKVKTRYFIPDFLKPSLDLVISDKKMIQVIKTQQNQNPMVDFLKKQRQNNKRKQQFDSKQFQDQEETNKKLSELLLCMKLVKNSKYPVQNNAEQNSNIIKGEEDKIQKQDDDKIQKNKMKFKEKRNARENLFYNQQICGWQDNDKINKKQKGKPNKFTIDELFDY